MPYSGCSDSHGVNPNLKKYLWRRKNWNQSSLSSPFFQLFGWTIASVDSIKYIDYNKVVLNLLTCYFSVTIYDINKFTFIFDKTAAVIISAERFDESLFSSSWLSEI